MDLGGKMRLITRAHPLIKPLEIGHLLGLLQLLLVVLRCHLQLLAGRHSRQVAQTGDVNDRNLEGRGGGGASLLPQTNTYAYRLVW